MSLTPPVMPASAGGAQAQLDKLKQLSRDADPETLMAAAQQFESVFTRMMLKSMREASFGDELFGGSQMEFYRDMHDQELANSLSGSIGLAEVMVRQLQRGQASAQADFKPADPAEFVEQLRPYAQATAHKLGVDADALIAQAALETGWGEHMLRDSQGRASFNLFNIKAHDWQGPSVAKRTLEYDGNTARTESARFRAYDSLQHAFDDYARFLQSNPRYADALAAGGDSSAYLQGLQDAGYATDPQYAAKIEALLNRAELKSGPKLADNSRSGVV